MGGSGFGVLGCMHHEELFGVTVATVNQVSCVVYSPPCTIERRILVLPVTYTICKGA